MKKIVSLIKKYLINIYNYVQNHKLLCLFLLWGGLFRYFNLNWDYFLTFHPDERNIALSVTRLDFFSALDPGFYAYNGFYIYLTRIFAEIISFVTNDTIWFIDWGHINFITRIFSATSSVISIFLFYKILKEKFSGLLLFTGMTIFTFCIGFIQYAHYGVTESFLVMMLLLIFYISTKTLKEIDYSKQIKTWILLGILIGISIGTKTTAISFVLIPFVVWIQALLKKERHISKHLIYGLIFVSTVFVCFLIVSPYSILNFEKFYESMTYESGVVSGKLMVPYNLQFFDTPVYVFQLLNLCVYIGPHIVLLSFGGLLFYIFKLLKQKRWNDYFLPIIVFTLLYFLYVGGWYTKFMRYLLLIIPGVIILALDILRTISKTNKTKPFVYLISVAIFVYSIGSSLFYLSIFSSSPTRIEASNWIYQNIEPGKKIINEEWDDGMPIDLKNFSRSQFEVIMLNPYDEDTDEKYQKYLDALMNADYYILSSRRASDTISRACSRYPSTCKFYRKLESGSLGYKKIAQFELFPNMFGLNINDLYFEESFRVYDHPTIRVYKNIKQLEREEMEGELID